MSSQKPGAADAAPVLIDGFPAIGSSLTNAAPSPTGFANQSAVPSPVPRLLNLGSGRQWHRDYLNVDINPFWKPDMVADFSRDLEELCSEVDSERFGRFRLQPGYFKTIVAHDVLGHVHELTQLMKNCLDLLEFGGTFDINVPYDLSFGAWQDPTHVRAFNERSWIYYTDWSWYLGWQDARFALAKLNFTLSERGKALAAQGLSLEDLTAHPRAVDFMHVVLSKVALTDTDRELLRRHQNGPQR